MCVETLTGGPDHGFHTLLKVAVTATVMFPTTVHDPVPEHPPLQPTNLDPGAGTAVSVMAPPGGKNVAVQVASHSMVPLDTMPPLPEPALVIHSVKPGCGAVGATVMPHAWSEYGDTP
jgi:hypothetical protein